MTVARLRLRQTVFESDDKVWHCAWSRDGSLLAACGSDKKCRIWRYHPNNNTTSSNTNKEGDGRFTLEQVLGEDDDDDDAAAATGPPHSRTVRCCEFSPDGLMLATASFDSTCVIWHRAATTTGGSKWTAKATLEGHENEVKCIEWSPSGRRLATCGRDKTCWVWERRAVAESEEDQEEEEWDCISVLTGHEGDVKCVRFRGENEVVSASYDNTIKIWRQEEEEEEEEEEEDGYAGDFACVQTLRLTDTVWGLCFAGGSSSGGDELMVACEQDGTLQSFAKPTSEFGGGGGQGGRAWEPLFGVQAAHTRPVFSVSSSSSSGTGEYSLLATASGDNSIGLWRIKHSTGFVSKLGQAAQAHEQDVNCARFRPTAQDGLLLASCGDDGAVRVWQVEMTTTTEQQEEE